MQETNITVCKNCGNSFVGKFCNNCGEKVYTDHDKSISHLFEEVFHFITHFDNKFFTTLFLFFRKPGFVSMQFCGGIRNRFFRPFSVFMIGVILYLLFPVLTGLNIPFKYYTVKSSLTNVGGFAENWALSKSKKQGISLEELSEKFNHKSPTVSKILLILIIPLTALGLSWLFVKSGKYFFDHFILAAEINSFYLYLIFLILPFLFNMFTGTIRLFLPKYDPWLGDKISIPIYLGSFVIFCAVAFMRFYQEKTFVAIRKSLLFLLLHSLVIFFIYRYILYSVVMLLI